MKSTSRESILREIAEVKQQIAHLHIQQEEAEITLQSLNKHLAQYDKENARQPITPSATSIPSDATMTSGDKIALFTRLFRGREDVYPKLWQNQKTAKKGYSPACSNEWIRESVKSPG